MMTHLRIGTRNSQLALAQTALAQKELSQLFPEMLHQQQDILLIIRQINQFCHVSCLPKNAAVYPLSELLQKNHTFYSEKCKWLPQFCHNLPPFFARCFIL